MGCIKHIYIPVILLSTCFLNFLLPYLLYPPAFLTSCYLTWWKGSIPFQHQRQNSESRWTIGNFESRITELSTSNHSFLPLVSLLPFSFITITIISLLKSYICREIIADKAWFRKHDGRTRLTETRLRRNRTRTGFHQAATVC